MVFIRQKPSGRYLIARKWINGRLMSVYITAMNRLCWFDPEDIKRKLPEKVVGMVYTVQIP